MGTGWAVMRAGGRRRTLVAAGGMIVPSIREVSLVGRPPGGWEPGDRVDRAGRSYRVVAGDDGYAHLRGDPGG